MGDEGGENGHLPVLLDSGDEPPTGAVHRFEINKIRGQSVSNSNVSVNHQRILLRCCRLGWGLRLCISNWLSVYIDAAGSRATI